MSDFKLGFAAVQNSEFYTNGPGKSIMDCSNYPKAIQDHLNAEIDMIQKVLKKGQYTGVFEIGSAQAENAQKFVDQGFSYFGIDINADFVQTAKERLKILSSHKQKAETVLLDFYQLSAHFLSTHDVNSYILFLPFNLFGNFSDKVGAIQKLLSLKQDFVISFYDISSQAYMARKDYYCACQFEDLEYHETKNFAHFYSADGLDSIAYRIDCLEQMICDQKRNPEDAITIEKLSFGAFGKAIYVRFLDDRVIKS